MSSAEEGTPGVELLAELGAMRLRALQKRAEELGVAEDKLDEADEKSEVIELIVQQLAEIAAREEAERAAARKAAREEAERASARKDELSGMKLRALQKRAAELGIDEDTLGEAEEKSEVIALILAAMALAPAVDGAEHKEEEPTAKAELIASIRGSATEREAAYPSSCAARRSTTRAPTPAAPLLRSPMWRSLALSRSAKFSARTSRR